MSTEVISVRLPEPLKERLDDLSSRTGRSGAFYIRAALDAYLEDLEDAYTADEAYREWSDDGFVTRPWDDLKKELGL